MGNGTDRGPRLPGSIPGANSATDRGLRRAQGADSRWGSPGATRALDWAAGGEGIQQEPRDPNGSLPPPRRGRRRSRPRRRHGGGSRLAGTDLGLVERLSAERAVEAAARAEAAVVRSAVRDSMARQVSLLKELAGAGVPFTAVAHRLELLAGRQPSVEARVRLAGRLWKRRERALTTGGRVDLRSPPPSPPRAPISSISTTTAAAGGQEMNMAQLKQRITEVFVVEDGLDEVEDVDVDEVDEELGEDREEPAPSRRSRR